MDVGDVLGDRLKVSLTYRETLVLQVALGVLGDQWHCLSEDVQDFVDEMRLTLADVVSARRRLMAELRDQKLDHA